MNFIRSNRFQKHFHTRAKGKLYDAFRERLKLFEANSFDATLSNHPLQGKWKGMRSINITGDHRLIFEEIGNDTYVLHDFGTHNELYKS